MQLMIPSYHSYIVIFLGTLFPLIGVYIYSTYAGFENLSVLKTFLTIVCAYPLMLIGCLTGEFLSRKIDPKFFEKIGDNPLQAGNLLSGWIFSHSYILLVIILVLLARKPT